MLIFRVAAVKADMVSSPGTSDRAHSPSGSVTTFYIDAKSCILGVNSTNHDNKKTKEEGMQSDGTCENDSSKAESMVDCVSEGPLAVVEKCTSLDRTNKVLHETSGLCDPRVKNINDILTEQTQEANFDGPICPTTSMRDSLPCDSSAKAGDNVESGGLQEPMVSTLGHHITSPLSSKAEQQASIDVVPPSESDDSHMRHDEDKSTSVDKLQSVSSLNTGREVVSEFVEGAINEKVSLPEVAENVKEKLSSFPSKSDIKKDKSFTFEVVATAGLDPIGKGQQLLPAIRACNLPTNTEESCINSSSSTLDPRKPTEVPLVTPQTTSGAAIQVGAKGNSDRKTRKKSDGKKSLKKGDRLKETTPSQSGRAEKSSVLSNPPAIGHILQFDESKPKEKVEGNITEPNRTLPFSDLPDLNNATSIFQQPFTDNQQAQLRAQILVYGSLISGMPTEEPYMIAAFGKSDTGRKTWEAAWRACVEGVHGQKSQASTPGTPMKPRSDLKDVDYRTPDPVINHSSLPSKVLSSPIGGVSNNTPPPALSPMIPLSSPLWNMSTPSSVGFPTSGMPRSALLDYRQSFSPLNPYQTPPVHNLSGHNPLWLAQIIS